jgi:hypothetical protein
MLESFGVHLKPSELRKDVKPLLKTACAAIFGTATGLVDLLVQHVPSSRAGAATKARPPAPAPPTPRARSRCAEAQAGG